MILSIKEPGFYWAIWIAHAEGTRDGKELTDPPHEYGIVHVTSNSIEPEDWIVQVPGAETSQRVEHFYFIEGPLKSPDIPKALSCLSILEIANV